MKTRLLYAGLGSDGQVAREELPVQELSDGLVQLLASPSFASDVAKGDVIDVVSSERPAIVVRRGGNVCVQLYSGLTRSDEMLKQLESEFQRSLLGSIDGASDSSMCFSISISAGFLRIENFFNAFVSEFPGVEWCYGNVYREDGVTPLEWWVDIEKK